MSASGETNTPFDCGCDPEKVFELADGGLSVDQEREVREHLASCPGCRELYERERDLSACLGSLDFSRMPRRSVCQSVAMALPTRSLRARVLWGLLAGALLVAALVSLELHGREPVILAMSILSACWGLIVGSTELTRAVFSAAGTTILLALALG
ncbi:MAG: zf-HC2 domain-containing protein, partial [Actinomycetota bacterium]|nr:zf-HC2 domain-containing protein [Actinomycetota bacterium]